MEHVRNTVKMALSASLENVTLFSIATTVLSDDLHCLKFLTSLITKWMKNMATILPFTNYIEKRPARLSSYCPLRAHIQEAQQATYFSNEYARSLYIRVRVSRSPMGPSVVIGSS